MGGNLFNVLFSTIKGRFVAIVARLRLWTSWSFIRARVIGGIRDFFFRLLDVKPKNKNDYYTIFGWMISKRLAYAVVVIIGVLSLWYITATTKIFDKLTQNGGMRTYSYNSILLRLAKDKVRIKAKSGQKKEETMDVTDKYASGSEDKLLLRRINDLKNKSEREYCVMYSAFLTPAEQSLIMRVDEFFGCISFDGGTEEAERRLCRIRTDEYQPDDGAPIALLSVAVTDTSAEISHRDVLGSLMGLGIRRDMIGDIFAAGNTALFFCHQSVSEYVIIIP